MAGGTDQRPVEVNLHIVRGADYAFTITVTDSAGSAVNISTDTWTADLLDSTPSVEDSFATAVSGAGNNVLTLTLTDTETAALTAQDRFRFVLDRTVGGIVTPWLAGWAYCYDRGAAVGGTDEPSTARVNDLNLAFG